mgnify:CR=1 FL=1
MCGVTVRRGTAVLVDANAINMKRSVVSEQQCIAQRPRSIYSDIPIIR